VKWVPRGHGWFRIADPQSAVTCGKLPAEASEVHGWIWIGLPAGESRVESHRRTVPPRNGLGWALSRYSSCQLHGPEPLRRCHRPFHRATDGTTKLGLQQAGRSSGRLCQVCQLQRASGKLDSAQITQAWHPAGSCSGQPVRQRCQQRQCPTIGQLVAEMWRASRAAPEAGGGLLLVQGQRGKAPARAAPQQRGLDLLKNRLPFGPGLPVQHQWHQGGGSRMA